MPLRIWLSWFLTICLNPYWFIGMAETGGWAGRRRFPSGVAATLSRSDLCGQRHAIQYMVRHYWHVFEEHSHTQDQLLYGSPDAELQQQILNSKKALYW